ncbi:apolipophorins [Leptopilina heterotoma]|uniref:apolipophorins n=1 Tax=Leptopilina heterotoma TaxID=63436 RepID=UPI001CAA3192|nr:apolipophorins [Leptopilina heterotoma]XP_043484878.1 apolipophorins [Leptopilina heterotoma]
MHFNNLFFSGILWTIVFVFVTVNGDISKDSSLCGRMTCIVPAERKFKYNENLYYQYQYKVDINTNLGEQDENRRDESTLFIDTIATVYFTSPCEGYLKLSNASISHEKIHNPDFPDRAGGEFKSSLERNTLRFAYDDGIIREVCPNSNEEIWVLNIKRGILSMLQNSMLRFDVDRRVDELDVNGICETRYQLHEAKKTSLLIKKTKNLAGCTHSAKHLSIIQSQTYRSPLSQSKIARQPLLKSFSDCEITIDHNIYEKVVCNDSHQFQPLSNGDDAGVRTNVSVSLQLISETANIDLDQFSNEDDDNASRENINYTQLHYIHGKRTNLLYDHGKSPKTIHGELRTSRDLLKSMCRHEILEEVQQSFSELFTKFVHSARMLDYSSLSQMFSRANSICKTSRDQIIKALPFIGSNAAVNLMKDLIIKKYISPDTLNTWVTVFALIPQPNQETIETLAPLLDYQEEMPNAQFILSYSAVIHAYCSMDSNCLNLEPISSFLSYLEKKIEKGCVPRQQSLSAIKETLEALKAIGNMGVESKTLVEKLRVCIEDSSGFLPMEVRLAAIDSHRRLKSCEETRDVFFLENYRNFTIDSEVRIASYLQVMRCPDYRVIKTIRHILEEEEVNQVGSFVWSHLQNLLSSSSPTRVEIQSLLTDKDLGIKFNSDLRKYSRNYDNSFFSEEYNFGGNYQGNLIFSPKSYVPRQATFNFTLDLFGESVNAFQMDVRMEGMEFYIESLFGPNGPFSGEIMGNHLKQFLRQFRSAPDEREDYWRQVNRLPNVIDNNFDNPKISLGYRVFGNELKFAMLEGDEEIRKKLASFNPLAKIKQILSGKEIHYENTAMLLDSSYVIPTTSGVPVRLDLTGSAAYNFKLSGLLNSNRLNFGELEMIGSIAPSVSLDITGTMTADSFYKSAGIKLRTNIYSTSAVETHVNIKGPRLVHLGLSLPNRKMEIFTFHSNVQIVKTNGAEVHEKEIGHILSKDEQNKFDQQSKYVGKIVSNTTCSWPALDRLIGLKLCTDYQFPNVSRNPNASYFLLNGPTLLKVSVIKADPTAKSYIIEYRMERNENESFIKLAFDTPGSQMKRELSATISFNVHSNNVTLALQSASNSFLAKGTYKRTDNETFINVGLDINGTKHLDASVGYTVKKVNYGFTYTPKLYLAINGERIAELTGMIRNQQKNNVSQCDITLLFQTKKVWSQISGYIMKRNTSLSGNVKIDYQLQKMPKKETLQVEASLINRSSKTLTYKAANVKLYSTAYPQLNTIISSWYQQAMGHVELHVEVNSSPHLQDDRHKLIAQVVVTYSKAYFQSQGAKISAFVALTKPIQNLDIKVGVNYFAIGDESKTAFLIRYGPGKEIIFTLNTIMPRGNMFAIEGHANLTIPNFNSMLVSAKITERSRNEYDIELAGTWFSGHNITVRGTYLDRSTLSITNYNLKLVLKSPSFPREILVNGKFYYDVTNLRTSFYVEQSELEKYALLLNYTALNLGRLDTYLEGRYKSNIYSILTKIDSEREIRIEMHLDRWRDVHLIGTAINKPNNKELGFEVKWDANRDPALKFATSVQLNRYNAIDGENENGKNLSALVTVTYPGRLVTAYCLLAIKHENNYIIDSRISWSLDKNIELKIDADYVWLKSLKFESKLLSPFENWKKTSLNANYLQNESQLSMSGSAYWQDSQHVLVNLHANSMNRQKFIEWNANCGLSSTVHSIKWVSANFTHKQSFGHWTDSWIRIKYHPDKVIDLRSIWQLQKGEAGTFNLTGNLLLVSPVVNYRKGEMKCLLNLLPNLRFLGGANIDLDKRKYTAHMIGDLAQFRESMVQFNITTPHERYAFVRGRFGLSEKNRHIVAEIIRPAGPLGFEGICQILTSAYDFNLKLSLATPIESLEKALFIAKLNKQEADFRVSYNNITAGFQGVWYYEDITHFDYTYILYTPVHGLHEIGIISKLVVTKTEPDGHLDVDTEFSLRLVELKVGFRAKGGPKPPLLHIPLSTGIKTNSQIETSEQDSDKEEEEEEVETLVEDIENFFYWKGEIELNMVIIEPITGSLDVDKEGNKYKISSVLKIPQGRITVDDTLYMEHVFNMKNDLSIETPFKYASEINSAYVLHVEDSNILLEVDLNVCNYTSWIETGLWMNYTVQKGIIDTWKMHLLHLTFKTPLQSIKHVDSIITLEVDENDTKANMIVRNSESFMNISGFLEVEEGFVDLVTIVYVNTSVLFVPNTKISLKRDLTDKEKLIEFGFVVNNGTEKSTNLKASWCVENQDFLKSSVILDTWIDVIKHIEVDILYNNTMKIDSTSKLNMSLKLPSNDEYKLTGEMKNEKVTADLHVPLGKQHLQFEGTLIPVRENSFNLEGELKNAKVIYKVTSSVSLEKDQLTIVEATITPVNSATKNTKYFLTLKKEKYGIDLNIKSETLNGTISMNCINALNWDLRSKIDTLNNMNKYDNYQLNTFMNVQINGNATLFVYVNTPWKELTTATIDGNLLLSNNGGHVRLNQQRNNEANFISLDWKLESLNDMFIKIVGNQRYDEINTKDVVIHLFLKSSVQAVQTVNTGFDIDIDKQLWRLASNATVTFFDQENFDVVLNASLPPPEKDDHQFLFSYHANKGIRNASYLVSYKTLRSNINYSSDGSLKMITRDIDGHLRFTWGTLQSLKTIKNFINATFDEKGMNLKYSLHTPKYKQQETFVLLFSYDAAHETYTLIDADLYLPADKKLGSTHISYASLVNVNGTINATTAIPNFSFVGCDFIVLTTLKQSKRLVKAFWPNNTALLDSDYMYHSERLDSTLDGHLHLQVPLSTRHEGHLTYGYKKRPQVTNGYSKLFYNNQEILNGQYKSKSESRAGFEKDEIKITVENILKPIGIFYVNQFEYSGGNEGTNYPTTELKKVHIYRLDNSSSFNVSGESRIHTTHDGQDVYLKAVHFNRTVQLRADYKILPGEFDQNTWLSLADDAWASYHINILNKSVENIENQFIVLGLVYPQRNFTINGTYLITSNELQSEAHLIWKHDQTIPRILGSAFHWKNISSNWNSLQQQAIFSLKHPSFEKDMTITGQIINRDERDLFNAAFIVDYSKNIGKLLNVSATIRDESDLPIDRKYTYAILGNHDEINLHLDLHGHVLLHSPSILETKNNVDYQRGNSEKETGELFGRINIATNEIEINRENTDTQYSNNKNVKYLWARYHGDYPVYTLNGSVINSPELNCTGNLFLNFSDKLTWMMVNYTPDAVESLRMYGDIPDVRNAKFDIWRTYDEDLTISDVTFYLRLNHSRLVTSTLRWRPDLRADLSRFIKTTLSDIYERMNSDVDFWRHTVRTETINVMSQVWDNAKEDMDEFLDDWSELRIIEQDFDALKIYLNNSYNANDFYVKDIVALGFYVIDELSLRSHIQSLPNLLNEIWEIMGESGEAIRNSLLWIIETIKNAYSKLSEIVSAILKGDSVSQIAHIVENLIEKYDSFIKDLHVSFIKYIENLWNKISHSISQQWYKFLRLLEPMFIRVIHYLETLIWKASKEVLDFLYDRRNEIITSPYYDRFTNFTQDIDKFYRDIKANDIITNIQKYSTILIKFIKERYFTFVPFGKELKDVLDEILMELKELKKLPSVQYTLDRIEQVYVKVSEIYEYFQVRSKIEATIRLIHSKLMDISQTALQAESRYREAKTKFIFDPNRGLMCFEQKLPMSWHAFNQTPEFQEIPEYRAITDVGSYFATSNATFWTLYYQFKPYTEPSNWFPPFKAHGMIVGAQNLITFDGHFIQFAGSCTYLLARDFVREQFAVLIKYVEDSSSENITHQIIVLFGKQSVVVDLFKDTVSIAGTDKSLQLPLELENGTAFVYQEESIVIIERKDKQFRLECNLKYDFCKLELSGWYYGKTAGILGTMNNEQMDDQMASDKTIVTDVGKFAHSWSLEGEECSSDKNRAIVRDNGPKQFCQDLFVNRSSDFGSCFNVVNPQHYYEICLNSANERESCTIAMAYMHACMFYDTYLRIPDKCTTCFMNDGTHVPEGQFTKLEGESFLKSTDIVFIVEAKECNEDVRRNRSLDFLITQLNKELSDQNFIDNRWSLVLFGGDGVFDQPRSLILDSQIFTNNSLKFVDYFNNIPIGDGNHDVFAALGFAAQLVFRPGVSKTFILLPCTHCDPENQTLDYSVLHQVLLERDITLHILMDGDFQFNKTRLNKMFYGLDATKSYTKKDSRILTGDVDLRRQVKLPKTALGYCTPLSLESNGTIFSGNKLRTGKIPSVKKFVTVFSKRIVVSAEPNPCQHCECIADNDGITKMECTACDYPTPVNVDYVNETFDEEFLSVLQPSDLDYDQTETDEDL